ncbi:MAG: DUF6285 domain-containing protein [Mycobacterium sp.]
MKPVTGRPTAAELVAAVADFLDDEVRAACDGQVGFHVRVAINVLRIVERELLDDTAGAVMAALDGLGFADEASLSRAIRQGQLDDRADDVMACLRVLVRHRLSIAHPGYDHPG